MSDRGSKQHLSIQALQIFDAVLVWFSFVLAAAIREPLRAVLGMTGGGEITLSLREIKIKIKRFSDLFDLLIGRWPSA